MDGTHRASVVLLICNGRFLLLRRSESDPSHPLWWGLPGGRMEQGENPLEAAIRETQEETGIRLHPNQLKSVGTYNENGHQIHLFKAITRRSTARLRDGEHDRYAWITKKEVPCYRVLPLVREVIAHA